MKNPAPTSIAYSVRNILENLVPDPDTEELEDTPARVERALKFLTQGYEQDAKDVLKPFDKAAYDAMVFEGNIPVFSLCAHHLTPFFGVAHIAYIPRKHIVGLSKLPRTVEIFARRLQIQERLTHQIANAINTCLDPLGVGVVMRCRHLCIESRGVQKVGSITYTSTVIGAMADEDSTREEFLRFVALADARTPSL